MNVSEKISSRRKELNLTLREVADFVGVSPSTVLRWEKGDIASLKANKIEKIAVLFKVDPMWILGADGTIKGSSENAIPEIDNRIFELVKILPFDEKIALYNRLSARVRK